MEQQELSLIGMVERQEGSVPLEVIMRCRTSQEAMRLCVNQARPYLSQEVLAEALGYQGKGTFNQILNSDQTSRPRYMSIEKKVHLEILCHNRVIDLWEEICRQRLINSLRQG